MSAVSARPRTKERLRLSLAATEPLPNCCPAAQQFVAAWEPVLANVRRAPDELAINVALLQLQHQYFQRYEMVPKSHKDHIGTRSGHTCLFQVYRYYYAQLRELLLTVNPPPMRDLPPPSPPPELAGMPFGIRK